MQGVAVAAAATLALVAVGPDRGGSTHANRQPSSLPSGSASLPALRPAAAVVGAGASTAAACSTAWHWSCVPPDMCTHGLFDGDTGPISPGSEWFYRMTIRPGGSFCAHWDSADIEGSVVGPGLRTSGSGGSVLTGTGLPGGTYTLTLRPMDSAAGPAHTRVEINVSWSRC
jgi:hypothetical protein